MFEIGKIGKIDNIESRLEDDGRRADSWPQWLNRASSGLSQVEDHFHGLTVYIAHPAVRDGHAPNTIIDQVEDTSSLNKDPPLRRHSRAASSAIFRPFR